MEHGMKWMKEKESESARAKFRNQMVDFFFFIRNPVMKMTIRFPAYPMIQETMESTKLEYWRRGVACARRLERSILGR
ncbi:hypothetical protein GDO81_016745 [Engystomops pustulosus]|uniref:Uncharacterized protein n=1 Tax=Engystomops pustulosus TaxID=76066 RepID=A0AAV7AEC7_ENGPU|nr:hypothetical protein GDO81_016745 [Engystomops pustulosus]